MSGLISMYDDKIHALEAEITRLKEQNEKYRKALVEVVSPEISYDVILGIALKALSEDK